MIINKNGFMKKILILLIISTSILIAQEKEKADIDSVNLKTGSFVHDGNWWLGVGALNQLPYLTGVFDGLSLGATIVTNSFNVDEICYQIGSSAADDFFNRMDTIKVGHMYEQLQELYSDSLNLCINFDDAFKYVVYKLSGYDNEKLKTLIEMYRKKTIKK